MTSFSFSSLFVLLWFSFFAYPRYSEPSWSLLFAENNLSLVETSAAMDTTLRQFNENCLWKLLFALFIILCSLLFDARYGRVNFVLASRLDLLKEVQRLQVKQRYKYSVSLFAVVVLLVCFESLGITFD